jgi:hypothetical protein
MAKEDNVPQTEWPQPLPAMDLKTAQTRVAQPPSAVGRALAVGALCYGDSLSSCANDYSGVSEGSAVMEHSFR